MRRAVLIMGPPGAGKGIQAELTAYHFGLIHFDTGRYIEELIRERRGNLSQKSERDFREGNLVDSTWALSQVKRGVKKIAQAGFGVVLSGSPRTVFEAFGDKKHEGEIPFLIKLYNRENIAIFKLEIPPEISLNRNKRRMVCSLCRRSHILKQNLRSCPFCGGKLIRRIQDKPEMIKTRLEIYKLRTEPVFNEFKKYGFRVIKVNGLPKPVKVFESIKKYLK